jgi:hypothetical protein
VGWVERLVRLLAERKATGHELTVKIGTASGLIVATRHLQIDWRQLGPGQKSAARRGGRGGSIQATCSTQLRLICPCNGLQPLRQFI